MRLGSHDGRQGVVRGEDASPTTSASGSLGASEHAVPQQNSHAIPDVPLSGCCRRYRLPRGARRSARRMVSDSLSPICSTKYLSTTSGRPPPASAALIRWALCSSRVSVA